MYIYVGIVDTAAAAAELVVWGYAVYPCATDTTRTTTLRES